MIRFSAASLVLLLAACASPVPKPVMPEAYYKNFAVLRVGYLRCGVDGAMPKELASTGLLQVDAVMFTYAYDIQRMQREITATHNDPARPSAEECRSLAASTLERARRAAQADISVETNHQAWIDLANGFAKFTPLQSPLVQPSTQQRNQQPTNEYQTVAVNTPSGIVFKRCKVLNGRAVYCI